MYSELLLYELSRTPWPLALLEPVKIHPKKQRPKTDDIDSAKIAEYAWRYCDKLTLWKPHEAIVEHVKVLLTTREQLVKQRTALSNTRTSLKRKYIQTPTANDVVDSLVDQLASKINKLETEIKRLIRAHPTLAQAVALVMTAPGVGLLLAANLLVITEGFTAPISYSKLAKHLGIAPLPFQSGSSVNYPARSRGKGPKRVRKLLHLAARSMVTHKDEFKHYYARKLAQGKPAKLVLNNVSNRLLRIVCSMLKNNKPYIEGYASVNPRLLST
ncbi:MAG: IS110 family transposase [Alteromonas sp.]|nr:IS110 family transposase [Alteromonas sp.]